MPIAAGSRFGTYQLDVLIGSGASGDVYRARDLELGRDVAIKVLSRPSSMAQMSSPMAPSKPSLNQLPVSAGVATPASVTSSTLCSPRLGPTLARLPFVPAI